MSKEINKDGKKSQLKPTIAVVDLKKIKTQYIVGTCHCSN